MPQDGLVSMEELSLVCEILKDRPWSWEDLTSVLQAKEPDIQVQSFKECFCQSSCNGFLLSPDFVSLKDVKSMALLKLQFIVVVDNKLGNGQLGKISYHFNVLGTDAERKLFGRNCDTISETLLKFPELFILSPDGPIGRRGVKCGSLCIQFRSFFQQEQKGAKDSFIHKMKYLLNLFGGTCSIFSAYEFARNLLNHDEKGVFRCSDQVFIKTLTNFKDVFSVSGQEVHLCSSLLWSELMGKSSPKASNINKPENKDSEGSRKPAKKIPPKKQVPLQQAPEVLTEGFVSEVLVTHGYPMDWTEFKNKFMSGNPDPDGTIAKFMEDWADKVTRSLCFSRDFVALNAPFHRNRLKLQLILEIRRRSGEEMIKMKHLKKQFHEIASDQEIEQTEIACDDFREFLWKFPKVFTVEGNCVVQGPDALRFSSFFEKEKDPAVVSVINKLNYFVNICGDHCNMKFACKFLQNHLHRKEEMALVDSDEKVMDLIGRSMSGEIVEGEAQVLIPEKEGKSTISAATEAVTPGSRMLSQDDKIEELTAILQEKYALPLKHVKECLAANGRDASWFENFIQGYAQERKHTPFILGKTYISMNTAFDRGFLKLCLLVRLSEKYRGSCLLTKISEDFWSICSGQEKNTFVGSLATHIKEFPCVFSLTVKSPEETLITPGPDMIYLPEFFKCTDHRKAGCRKCLLINFLNISGCRCHCDKVFNFLKIAASLYSKDEKELKKDEFKRWVGTCQGIQCLGSMIMISYDPTYQKPKKKIIATNNIEVTKLVSPQLANVMGTKQSDAYRTEDQQVTSSENDKVDSSSEDSSHPPSSDNKELIHVIPGASDPALASNPKEGLIGSAEQAEKVADHRPYEESTSPMALSGQDEKVAESNVAEQSQSASEESNPSAAPSCQDERDAASNTAKQSPSTSEESTSSVTSKKSRHQQKRKGNEASNSKNDKAADCPSLDKAMENSMAGLTLGTVQVVNNDLVLVQTLSAMGSKEKVVVSVMCNHDTLVALDDSQNGFVIPITISANSFTLSRWRILESFFKMSKVVMVTFDCEHVGRCLFSHLNLRDCIIFDIKIAVELILAKAGLGKPCYASVGDLCHRLNLPGPDQMAPQIVGNTEVWDGNKPVKLDSEGLTKIACHAAALASGVYSWLFEQLGRWEAFNELRKLTSNKLQILYSVKELASLQALPTHTHTQIQNLTGSFPSKKPDTSMAFPNASQNSANTSSFKTLNLNSTLSPNSPPLIESPLVAPSLYPNIQPALGPISNLQAAPLLPPGHVQLPNQFHAPTNLVNTHSAIFTHPSEGISPIGSTQISQQNRQPMFSAVSGVQPSHQGGTNLISPTVNSVGSSVNPRSFGNFPCPSVSSSTIGSSQNGRPVQPVPPTMTNPEPSYQSGVSPVQPTRNLISPGRIPQDLTSLQHPSESILPIGPPQNGRLIHQPVPPTTMTSPHPSNQSDMNFIQPATNVISQGRSAQNHAQLPHPSESSSSVGSSQNGRIVQPDHVTMTTIPGRSQSDVNFIQPATNLISQGRSAQNHAQLPHPSESSSSVGSSQNGRIVQPDPVTMSTIPGRSQSGMDPLLQPSGHLVTPGRNLLHLQSEQTNPFSPESSQSSLSHPSKEGLQNVPGTTNPQKLGSCLSDLGESWFSRKPSEEVDSRAEDLGFSVAETHCLCKDGDAVIEVPQEEARSYDQNLSGISEELLCSYSKKIRDSIDHLLSLLGSDIAATLGSYLQEHGNMEELTEIILDAGRLAEARFHKCDQNEKQTVVDASNRAVTTADIQAVEKSDALTGFDEKNCCGIEGSLHSVRGVRSKRKKLIGLTIRVGLPRLGCAGMIYDIHQTGKSTLILGYSGVGKTTLLRELARCLSDNEKKRVVIIDTYNEIAGDSDCSHFSIGSARRFQIDQPETQHEIMQEAARNHSADVIIIDQIESREDVIALTRLSKSGVQIIAGANRESIQNVISDANLSLIFRNDEAAFDDVNSLDSAGALAKARINPAFQALVEMKTSNCWHIHDLSHTYSNITANQAYSVQERRRIKYQIDGWDEQILLREILIDQY